MAHDIGAVTSGGRDIGALHTEATSYTPDLGASGWTTLPSPHASARTIYVDSVAGSDSNDGFSSGAPKSTLAAGEALVRNGYGDHIYLKCGSSWAEIFDFRDSSGLSEDYPTVLAAYGDYDDGLPQIQQINLSAPSASLSHAHAYHIHCERAVDTTGCLSLLWRDGGVNTNIRIEGCWFVGGSGNSVQCQDGSSLDGLVIHRCLFVDAESSAGHSQGLFISPGNCSVRPEVTESYWDHNGWEVAADQTIYNHNIYAQYGDHGLALRKCFLSRASSHGVHHRCGGVNEDNTYYKNAINLQFGYNDVGINVPQVSGYVRRNVIVDGRDINGADRWWGMYFQNLSSVDARYNIVAHATGSNADPRALEIAEDPENEYGVQNGVWRKNVVYKWGGGLRVNNDASDNFTNLTIEDNDFQVQGGGEPIRIAHSSVADDLTSGGNRCYSPDTAATRYHYNGSDVSFATLTTAIGDTTSTETDLSGTYTDPEKDMDDYAVSIGLADADALLTQIRTQRKGNWDLNLTPDRINAYFRANFDMIPAPSSFTATKDSLDVDLEWDAIPEASGYIIERRTDGGSWEQIGSA